AVRAGRDNCVERWFRETCLAQEGIDVRGDLELGPPRSDGVERACRHPRQHRGRGPERGDLVRILYYSCSLHDPLAGSKAYPRLLLPCLKEGVQPVESTEGHCRRLDTYGSS